MPAIEIRHVVKEDLDTLIELEHNYSTSFVWQMDLQVSDAKEKIQTGFRQVRLPREVKVNYPRNPNLLRDDWTKKSCFLVAVHENHIVGYICMDLGKIRGTNWVTDIVVKESLRRKGIGTALLLSGMEWGESRECRYTVLEIQPKNHPMVQFANKIGFDFCGYNDCYFEDGAISFFFCKPARN